MALRRFKGVKSFPSARTVSLNIERLEDLRYEELRETSLLEHWAGDVVVGMWIGAIYIRPV